MSQTGKQIITVYTLANILRSKGNQKMKFGQLIKIMAGRKTGRDYEVERLVPELFLFLKKALYEAKASVQHLSFNIFW